MSREHLMTSYALEAAAAGIGLACEQTAHTNDVRSPWMEALAGGAQA